MKPILTCALLATAFLGITASAFAVVVANPTGTAKIMQADLIASGSITALEDKTVEVAPLPKSPGKATYRIAVLKVTQTLKGKTETNEVRIGFIPTKQTKPAGGAALVPKGPIATGYNLQLTVGQEGLFYLKKHHEGNFYILPMLGTFVSAQNKAALAKEIQETSNTLKLLSNPLEGLKDKDVTRRLEIVSVLLPLYRTPALGTPSKQSPIEAEESKLILKTLLEADWDFNKYKGANFQQNPASLFSKLNLTAQQGFQDPKKGIFTPEYAQAAKTWLEKHWQSYRIQKYTAAEASAAAE